MAASDQNARAAAPGPQAAALFETPLIVDEMPDCTAVNAALRAAILKRREESEGISISNVGGWHSDTQMLDWGGEAARSLSRRIIAAADRFTADIRGGDVPRHKWAAEMWANVSPPGASNRHHCHPGAYWSAVYYVDDGYDGSPDRALGGELVLFDPRMPTVRMAAPDLRFRRPGQQPDHDEVKLRPSTGRIVIFPAWLSHAVLPYCGHSTRISIAVNLTAVALVSRAPT
ncbi:MAG TPA: TIGR02466 family protein [Allosphingosinicella sp.]|jgi:uncharacterized protein (TIGR02466 family)